VDNPRPTKFEWTLLVLLVLSVRAWWCAGIVIDCTDRKACARCYFVSALFDWSKEKGGDMIDAVNE
jgi:hypothetical protein